MWRRDNAVFKERSGMIHPDLRDVALERLVECDAPVSGFVYIVQSVRKHSPFKIGYAKNVGSRLEELQTGNPYRLRIIATRPGSYELEKAFHGVLSRWRLEGEWYAVTRHSLRALYTSWERCPGDKVAITPAFYSPHDCECLSGGMFSEITSCPFCRYVPRDRTQQLALKFKQRTKKKTGHGTVA